MKIGRRMVTAGVVVAAVTVGGVAGAVIGIPGLSSATSSSNLSTTAQSGDTPTAGPHVRGFGFAMGADKGVLDAAAKALNLSTQDLLQKLSDGTTTIADVAKDQKVDVQTVIDAMVAVAKTDISNLVNNPFPAFPHFKGLGPMGGSGTPGPMMGGLGFGFGLRGALGGSIDSVAKALGISTQDLVKDLANGQSIAGIANAKNVDLSTIVDQLANDAKSHLGDAVKAGHLTQDQADKIEAGLKDMITKMLNNAGPSGLGHFGGFGRHHGRGGFPFEGPGGDTGGSGGSGSTSVPAPPA